MITTFLQTESSSSHGDMTLMPKTAPILSPSLSNESEKLIKMKNRKMKKQAQKDVKNVKQVIVTEGVTGGYNIENILEELGESETNKKSVNKKSNSKAKADRKRSRKLSNIGKKDKRPADKFEHISADDTTGGGEEDNEALVEESHSYVNSQELLSSTNWTVSPELSTQVAMLNLQTSQSTEDMFTPVINKLLDQNSKLEGEIQNRNESNSELKFKNQGLNDFLKSAEDQNSKLEKANQNVKESRLSELEGKNQGLNEFLKIAEDQNSKLEKEIQNVKESRLCKICLDNEVSQVFLPCGHSICCNECVVGIQICPICRENIRKSQMIYFS